MPRRAGGSGQDGPRRSKGRQAADGGGGAAERCSWAGLVAVQVGPAGVEEAYVALRAAPSLPAGKGGGGPDSGPEGR